jgi:hypothetical protein
MAASPLRGHVMADDSTGGWGGGHLPAQPGSQPLGNGVADDVAGTERVIPCNERVKQH